MKIAYFSRNLLRTTEPATRTLTLSNKRFIDLNRSDGGIAIYLLANLSSALPFIIDHRL